MPDYKLLSIINNKATKVKPDFTETSIIQFETLPKYHSL